MATTPPVSLGNLGGPVLATVDERGRIRGRGTRWELAWAVRTDDGWHEVAAARSGAVTQRRVGGTPVVETALRVARGQVIERTYAGRSASGTDALVVEIENASPAPIAVALAVTGANRIDLDELRLLVDGSVALRLPRRPSRTAASVADVLSDGGATEWPGILRTRRRRAEAAVVFPLAHTARLRIAVGADVDVDVVPAAEHVVAGWSAHLDARMRVELPDAAAGEAVRADLADLLVRDSFDAGSDADALLALDRFGHHGPVGDVLRGAVEDRRLDRAGGAALLALAEHWRLTGDVDLEDALGTVAAAAHRLRRTAGPEVQLGAAELLDAAGQPDAAALCRRRATGRTADAHTEVPAATSPAGRLLALRDTLVMDDEAGLTLAPRWPDEWLGRGIEVHRAPTRWGRLAYAVRWHGARPALLWEHESPGAVTVRCGLDPAWSTTAARGEALLAPVEPAGGLPKVVAPLGDERTPVDEAADEGTGFR